MKISSMMCLGVAAVLVCSCARPQAVAAAPEDPCKGARTQAELTRCWSRVAELAESRLMARQTDAVARLRQKDAGAAAALLEQAQTKWEQYRDAQCAAVARLYEGGSSASMQTSSCRARVADQRKADLDAMLVGWGASP